MVVVVVVVVVGYHVSRRTSSGSKTRNQRIGSDQKGSDQRGGWVTMYVGMFHVKVCEVVVLAIVGVFKWSLGGYDMQ